MVVEKNARLTERFFDNRYKATIQKVPLIVSIF